MARDFSSRPGCRRLRRTGFHGIACGAVAVAGPSGYPSNALSALPFRFLVREIFEFEGASSWALIWLSQSARTT
jgi:hypothetical protein